MGNRFKDFITANLWWIELSASIVTLILGFIFFKDFITANLWWIGPLVFIIIFVPNIRRFFKFCIFIFNQIRREPLVAQLRAESKQKSSSGSGLEGFGIYWTYEKANLHRDIYGGNFGRELMPIPRCPIGHTKIRWRLPDYSTKSSISCRECKIPHDLRDDGIAIIIGSAVSRMIDRFEARFI